MKHLGKGIWILIVVLFSLNTFVAAQTAAPSAAAVNLNSASQADLEKLPGIGPSLAKKILEFRQKNGNFKAPTDLIAVQGIGEKKFEQIKNMVTVK